MNLNKMIMHQIPVLQRVCPRKETQWRSCKTFSSFSHISLSFLQLSRSMKLFHSSITATRCSVCHSLIHFQSINTLRIVQLQTWENLLQVIYDWYTIFIFHLQVTFGIHSLLTIVRSHDAVDNKKSNRIITWKRLEKLKSLTYYAGYWPVR